MLPHHRPIQPRLILLFRINAYTIAAAPPVAPAMPKYVSIFRVVIRPEDGPRGIEVFGSSATRVIVVHRFGTGPRVRNMLDSAQHANPPVT